MSPSFLSPVVNHLSRFRASLDGCPDASSPFIKHLVPWFLSTPLLSQVSLSSAASFLFNTAYGDGVGPGGPGGVGSGVVIDCNVAAATMQQAATMINEKLRSDDGVSDEAIAAVVQMVVDKWCYSDDKIDPSSGLRLLGEMVSARDGMAGLGLGGLLGKLAFSADKSISISLEIPSFLPSPQLRPQLLNFPQRPPGPFRVPHSTPFVADQPPFVQCAAALDLHPATAGILDDVRFLLSTVLKLPRDDDTSEKEAKKLETTARWIHSRILSLSLLSPDESNKDRRQKGKQLGRLDVAVDDQDYSSNENDDNNGGGDGGSDNDDARTESGTRHEKLHRAVRLASLIYTTAILSRTSLSRACPPDRARAVWTAAGLVPLATWKGMLGVFVWLVSGIAPAVVASSCSEDQGRRSAVKNALHVACSQLALEGWDVAAQAMERTVGLHRWLHAGTKPSSSSPASSGEAGQAATTTEE